MERELPIRIKVVHTLDGVALAVQRGKAELLKPTSMEGALSFDFTVRVAERKDDGEPNILGPYAFGTPNDRFFYVCVGTLAGQRGSPWQRRAKIKTKDITCQLVEQTLAKPGGVLEGQVEGRAKDGSPSCATVPLLENWKVRTA